MRGEDAVSCFWALYISRFDPLFCDPREDDRLRLRIQGRQAPQPLVPRHVEIGFHLARQVADDAFERSKNRGTDALAGKRAPKPITKTALARDQVGVKPPDVWPLIHAARNWFFPSRTGLSLSDRSIFHRLARERKRQGVDRRSFVSLRRCRAAPCRHLIPIGSPRDHTCSDACYMRLYRAKKSA
jgi:hypothetical protein